MAALAATDCARSRTSILKHAGVDALSPPSLPEATGLRFDPSVLMPRTRSPPGLTFLARAVGGGFERRQPSRAALLFACYPGLYRGYPFDGVLVLEVRPHARDP